VMVVIYLISIILGVIGLGAYVGFVISEGKDERGEAILAKSAQIAFVLMLLGFTFHIVYFQFANLMVEQIQATMTVWMSLVIVSNSLRIFYYRKKI